MRKILLMCIVAFLWSGLTFAQDRTITGKVVDESGSPMPGVNISAKGTTRGTTTDGSGNYSLNVLNDDKVLIFSFIGYKTLEQTIGNQSVINLNFIPDTQTLTEVVVTAQGIERNKNELPFAAQRINGDDISKTRDNNFINSLSGKVSGVQITRNNNLGGSTNIVIRGSKSLTNNNQPLFIIDGVPIDNSNTNATTANGGNGSTQTTGGAGYDYGNAASDINPDDIESINVLKGAASTALYGNRGSNGVVLITTKKGTKKGLGITVNTGLNVGSIDKSTFAKYQHKYGAGYASAYEDPTGYFFYRPVVDGGPNVLITPTTEDASYGAAFDPKLQVYQWDAFDKTSPNYGKSRPWVAAAHDPTSFFVSPVSSSNSILLDGGFDKGYYKIGYTRTDDRGILPNSRLTKDYVNFSASYNLTDKLTTTATVNYTNQTGQGRYGSGYDNNNVATNFRQWWETNVDVLDQKAAYDRTGQNTTWNWSSPTSLTNRKPAYWDNPYFTRYQSYENDGRVRYFGNIRLDYKITKWLSLMGRTSVDSYNEFQEERQAFGSITPASYTKFLRSYKESNYDLMASINKDLSESFNLKAVVGYNGRRNLLSTTNAFTNGGLVIPGLYSLSNSLNPITPPLEYQSDVKVNGVYASLNLSFKKFLFLDLTMRRDGASTLPKGSNLYNYPSVSGSFLFSELLKEKTWLTSGKLRANYAEVGGPAAFAVTRDYYRKPTAFGSIPLFNVPVLKNNPNLVPERTISYEVGAEVSFLDNRIGFDASYYNTHTIKQLIPVSVSRASGYDQRYLNSGDVQNQGIEVTLFGTPIKTNSFSWSINVNWTMNRNKVISLSEGIENLELGSFQQGISINAAKGQPYGTIRGTDYVYTNGQKTIDKFGYYKISKTSNNIIGNTNPNWIGGISNTLRYKNTSFSFLIDTKQGGNVYSLDLAYGMDTGLYPETAGNNELGNPVRDPVINGVQGGGVLYQGVKSDGTPNTTRADASVSGGAFGYEKNPSKAFVYDASFVKLREVSLNYSFPKSFVSKLGPVKGIDFSIIGRNLWVIQKNLPYADPEASLSSGNLQGYQVGVYPVTRNLGFNVKLRF